MKTPSFIFFYGEMTISVDGGEQWMFAISTSARFSTCLSLTAPQFRWLGYQMDENQLDYQAEKAAGNDSLYLKACYKYMPAPLPVHFSICISDLENETDSTHNKYLDDTKL